MRLSVNLSPMSDINCNYHKLIILDISNQTIVPDAVSPEALEIPGKGLAMKYARNAGMPHMNSAYVYPCRVFRGEHIPQHPNGRSHPPSRMITHRRSICRSPPSPSCLSASSSLFLATAEPAHCSSCIPKTYLRNTGEESHMHKFSSRTEA